MRRAAGDPAFAKATAGERLAIDLSTLPIGVYYVQVVERESGERVVVRLLHSSQ